MKLTKAEKQILKDLNYSTDMVEFYGSADSLYQSVALYIFRRNIQHPAVDSFRTALNKLSNCEIYRDTPEFEEILMSYKKENK